MMKKRIYSIMLAVMILLSLSVTAFADIYWYNLPDFGVSYDLSSDWVVEQQYVNGYDYKHYQSGKQEENLNLYTYWVGVNTIDEISETEFTDLFSRYYSDSNLAQKLSVQNNVNVTVVSDSVLSKYEWYNNRKWYRYEKAYTASAFGYYSQSFYNTTLVTVVGNRMIEVDYSRNPQLNHFSDIAGVLDNISIQPLQYRGIEENDPDSLAGMLEEVTKDSEIAIYVNGNKIVSDVAPIVVDDRTLVPVRVVSEALNYQVDWDDATQEVKISDGDKYCSFKIGSPYYESSDGLFMESDVEPQIINDRTYLPLRLVAENLDAEVNWNEEANSVEIYK